jgi:hypothetical protein
LAPKNENEENEKMAKQRMKSEDVKIKTPEFRVSYPNVFEAVKVNPTDKTAKYGVVAIFQVAETEKSKAAGTKIVDIEPLKQLCRNVAIEKFGPDRTKWPMLKFPFRDGGTEPSHKDKDGYGPGTIFVSIQSVNKPGVVESFAGPDGRRLRWPRRRTSMRVATPARKSTPTTGSSWARRALAWACRTSRSCATASDSAVAATRPIRSTPSTRLRVSPPARLSARPRLRTRRASSRRGRRPAAREEARRRLTPP